MTATQAAVPWPTMAGIGEHEHDRLDHDEIAVGEVDQSDDAVDHGVAQCHQRVHAADFQTVEQLADEHDDLIGHSSPFLSMLWFSTAARERYSYVLRLMARYARAWRYPHIDAVLMHPSP